MSQQKPTREQEEALKDVLEDECFGWKFEKMSAKRKIRNFFVFKYWRIREAYFEVKCFFQRVFRKNHLSDMEIRECGFDIAKYSLKKVKAFRTMNRQGYPGTLNNIEEWNEVLDEIILKLDLWIKFFEHDDYESICTEQGWEYPYAKKIEYKEVRYVFKGKDGSRVFTDDLDYDVKNPNYTYCGRQVSYFSKEAYEEMQKRAEEGLLLLAKWLQWMWD